MPKVILACGTEGKPGKYLKLEYFLGAPLHLIAITQAPNLETCVQFRNDARLVRSSNFEFAILNIRTL